LRRPHRRASVFFTPSRIVRVVQRSNWFPFLVFSLKVPSDQELHTGRRISLPFLVDDFETSPSSIELLPLRIWNMSFRFHQDSPLAEKKSFTLFGPNLIYRERCSPLEALILYRVWLPDMIFPPSPSARTFFFQGFS